MAANSGETPKRRNGPGRPFVKGQSGNPCGKSMEREALRRYILQDHGRDSILGIVELARCARSDKVRLDAFIWLAEQAVGKAVQAVSAPDGGPLVDIASIAVALRKAAGEDDGTEPR